MTHHLQFLQLTVLQFLKSKSHIHSSGFHRFNNWHEEQEPLTLFMATATKSNIALRSPQGTEFAVERFLASMDWNDCGNYRRECVAHWTKLFATDEVAYTEPIIQNLRSFIDYPNSG